MSDGGVKFTWTVSRADHSDGQILCERGKHDSQLVKNGRGGSNQIKYLFSLVHKQFKKCKHIIDTGSMMVQ